jgi:hypothetical protein
MYSLYELSMNIIGRDKLACYSCYRKKKKHISEKKLGCLWTHLVGLNVNSFLPRRRNFVLEEFKIKTLTFFC